MSVFVEPKKNLGDTCWSLHIGFGLANLGYTLDIPSDGMASAELLRGICNCDSNPISYFNNQARLRDVEGFVFSNLIFCPEFETDQFSIRLPKVKLFQDSNREVLTQPEGHLLDIWANEVRSIVGGFSLPEQFVLPAVAEQLNWAKEQLRQVNDPVICIGLGGSEKEKRYPIHKWKQVIHRLNSEGFYLVLLGGDDCLDPGDPERGVSLVGKINITQSVALTKFSSLLISADTGIGHLAAAQGVRTISLFGSYTLPERCRPYGDNNLTLITPSTTAPTMSAEAVVQHAIKMHEGVTIPERSVTLDSEDNNWINLTFSRFARKIRLS